MAELITEGRILWPENPQGRPRVKVFLKDLRNTFTGFSSIVGGGIFTRNGTRDIEDIFTTRVFEFPKPYELISQLILQGCLGDGVVLDSFAGSGTTAHAVLALNKEDGGNRRFILVECEDYADSITAERVRRVINGVPGARDAALRDGLGGSFTYCTLGEPIEMEAMLRGDALPAYESLAAYLLYTASGLSAGEGELRSQNGDGLFYETEKVDYYLMYQPDADWLRSNDAALNAERAERIGQHSRAAGKKAVVFGACKYLGQRDLTDLGITFCQLPYELPLRT